MSFWSSWVAGCQRQASTSLPLLSRSMYKIGRMSAATITAMARHHLLLNSLPHGKRL